MDQKTVRKLELELEKAIGDVAVQRLGLKSLPLLPSQQTMHLMAKAAVGLDGNVSDVLIPDRRLGLPSFGGAVEAVGEHNKLSQGDVRSPYFGLDAKSLLQIHHQRLDFHTVGSQPQLPPGVAGPVDLDNLIVGSEDVPRIRVE